MNSFCSHHNDHNLETYREHVVLYPHDVIVPMHEFMSWHLPSKGMSRLRSAAGCVLLLQIQGPDIMPFTLEKENLILGLWQVQQAGQDFRIKEVGCFWYSKLKLELCPDCCFRTQQASQHMIITVRFPRFDFSCGSKLNMRWIMSIDLYTGQDTAWHHVAALLRCCFALVSDRWWFTHRSRLCIWSPCIASAHCQLACKIIWRFAGIHHASLVQYFVECNISVTHYLVWGATSRL